MEFRAFPKKRRSGKAGLVPRPLDIIGLAWGRILSREEETQDAGEAVNTRVWVRHTHTGEGLFSGLLCILRQGL